MQQFTVPQFIDVEDKIIGPITARQFIIMLGGFFVIAICYKIFRFIPFLIIGLCIFSISGVFAFVKINGMAFHYFILNFVQTGKRPGLRVWNNRIASDMQAEIKKTSTVQEVIIPTKEPITTSRLTELSLIVDTKGGYSGEREEAETNLQSEKLEGKHKQ